MQAAIHGAAESSSIAAASVSFFANLTRGAAM